MGVDARILVKVKNQKITPIELTKIAADMAATLGAEKFFIQREPLFKGDKSRHALSLVEKDSMGKQVWEQDGDPIIAEDDEQFIEVHLWTRYYGEGYERGDWPFIRSVAEFLENRISECEIWYGGDSGGRCAELLDEVARKRINSYFLANGHAPYRGYFGRSEKRLNCVFCGDRPMNNSGGGGSCTFYSCDGCGLQSVFDSISAKRLDLKKEEEFFKYRETDKNRWI